MLINETEKVFDINRYLQQNLSESYTEKEELTFHHLVRIVQEELNRKFDDTQMTDDEMAARQELEHNGTIGIKSAENLLVSEIESILRNKNLLNVKYPAFYESLSHGIFHEIYRFGVFHKWETVKESPSAIISGRDIWFKIGGRFIKQKERLRDDSHIDEIIRLLQIGNSNFKINDANPEGELILNNGVRIKVLIPPLSSKPMIVFRKFIVDKFSFERQAELNTIPKEDIELYKSMSKLYLNTIIAGPVESGKSTFLKTIYGSRDDDKVAILIESSPESFLGRDFPDRLVHELYTDHHGNIHDVIRSALRIDHDYIIVQEVRGIEAEGAISATERGTRGTLMTYHITDPAKTPQQLAQHIVDAFPNRNIVNEIRRIASQIDIGITMQTFPNNQKKITSIYELCYDYKTDSAWINYLMKYDVLNDTCYYNANISDTLKERIYILDIDEANKFMNLLEQRSKLYPLQTETIQEINFK